MEKNLDARLKEEYVSSEEIFKGKIIGVQVDTVRLPDGKTARREVVKHPGAVVILPLTDNKEVVLVRQYRHATGEILLELPAGNSDQHHKLPPPQRFQYNPAFGHLYFNTYAQSVLKMRWGQA
jgi:ADP-ribose pyrophosphatase